MKAKAGGELAAREFIKFAGVLAFAIFMGKVVIFKKSESAITLSNTIYWRIWL